MNCETLSRRCAMACISPRAESKPGTQLQRTIEMMDRQLSHLVHLVDDLMDVGRISTGKIELRRERVNLREVLAVSVEACRSAIDRRGHTLVRGGGHRGAVCRR